MPGHSCQGTLPLWWVLERGGDRSGLAQPRGACVARGRAGHQVGSLGNASHTMAYGGVGLVPSYTGLVGRARADASSAPSTNTVISPTSRSSSGWGVRGCVCWCPRSACTPPLLAGVCGMGVCVWARVSAAPRDSWLGCWGVCVLVSALRLYPATPGCGVRRGYVCFGSVLGCTPPLLAGVCSAAVGVWARVLAAPRHSWLGCGGVCLLVCAPRLHPATPGSGER